jgi:hypothetical protein
VNEITYSSLQSVFQLAVALNLTFAVLLSLFSESLKREKRILSSLIDGIKSYHPSKESVLYSVKLLNDSELLSNDIDLASTKLDDVFSNFFRPIFIIVSVVSFCFLMASSIVPTSIAGLGSLVWAAFCMMPFAFFAAITLYISFHISRRVTRLSQLVDETLCAK